MTPQWNSQISNPKPSGKPQMRLEMVKNSTFCRPFARVQYSINKRNIKSRSSPSPCGLELWVFLSQKQKIHDSTSKIIPKNPRLHSKITPNIPNPLENPKWGRKWLKIQLLWGKEPFPDTQPNPPWAQLQLFLVSWSPPQRNPSPERSRVPGQSPSLTRWAQPLLCNPSSPPWALRTSLTTCCKTWVPLNGQHWEQGLSQAAEHSWTQSN